MKALTPDPRLPMTAVEREVVYERHLSLRDFGEVLRRRKAIALFTFLMVLAIGTLIVATTKPLYQSKTRILVEQKPATVAVNNADNPLSSLLLPAPIPEVDTQVEVLQSADLRSRVARRIGVDPKTVTVEVRQLGKTDLAELTATSNSRTAAENFAATLPAVYLEDLKNGRMDAVTTGLRFARRRLAEKTVELRNAEQELREFKSRAGVVDPAEERTQDITASATAHAAARQAVADAAGARARLEALQAARRQLPGTISTPVTVTNPEVALLKERIASLREERARNLFLFKPGTDEIRKIDVALGALQNRLAATPATLTTVTRAPNPALAELDAKIADNMAQYRAARASWDAADANAVRLQSNLARYNAIEMQQAQLQRAIDQGRSSVEMLAKSVEEMSLRERAAEAASAPIKIIGAIGPAEQIAPRVARSLIVVLLLGFLLACAVAFLRDSLDSHVKSEDEARAVLGLPILGHLPRGNAKRLLLAPDSDMAQLESYRMLRSNLQHALVKCPERVVQITSTLAGEGKTRVAANLAMVTALDNWRVILVDGNLRNPQLAEIFDAEASPGLADVLADRSTLEAALQQTSIPNLRVLTAGNVSVSSIGLLNSPEMDELLLKLSATADYVFFDSPSCLSAADAQVLASKVDGVLFVMEIGKVATAEVHRSFELLQNVGANVLGMALSNAAPVMTGHFIDSGGRKALALPNRGDAGSQVLEHPVEQDAFAYRVLSNPQQHSARKSSPDTSYKASRRSSLPQVALGAGLALAAILGFQAIRSRGDSSSSAAPSTAADGEAKTPLTRTMQAADVIGDVQQWQSTPGKASGSWHTLSADDVLNSTAGIRTGSEAALLLQLGQEGVLRVGANTSLKIRPVADGEYSVTLMRGKVWGLVRSEAGQSSLQVRTPAATVAGTDGAFSVASGYNGGLTMVSTHKGTVTVRRGQRTVKVAPGQALRVEAASPSPLKAVAQKAPAREMWRMLQFQESWLTPGGAMQLDHATVFQMLASADDGS